MEQKELKELYKNELKKAWDGLDMVEFCANSAEYIIEHNGELFEIDRPTIKTRFCFGYGFNGISSDEEEQNADDIANDVSQKEEYFISENLKPINKKLESLQNIKKDMVLNWAENNAPHYLVRTQEHYAGQSPDCMLRAFAVYDVWEYGAENCNFADIELIDKLINGFEQVKASFLKRLQTYIKKYGLSKIEATTFLRD